MATVTYKVCIETDHDCPSPEEGDCNWAVYNFAPGYANSKDRSAFAGIGLASRLKAGRAWLLEKRGEDLRIIPVAKHTDIHKAYGIMVFDHPANEMGAKTWGDRKQDAQSFLDEYNDWASGFCYGYTVERVTQCDAIQGELPPQTIIEPLESCWGFIGHSPEHMLDEIRATLEGRNAQPYQIVRCGDAAHTAPRNIMKNNLTF